MVAVSLLLAQHGSYIGDIRPLNIMMEGEFTLKLAVLETIKARNMDLCRAIKQAFKEPTTIKRRHT